MIFCKILISIVLFLYFSVLFLIVYGSKYRNPYRLYMVFGKKGSGKTTLITKLTLKHLKRGWKVYSTVPVPGALLFDAKDIGKIAFEQNSVLFLDEGGILFDNRNFKAFREDTRDWFKYQRHYRVKVYVFSQAFDIDVKLRNLTDYMYLTTNFFNVISVARRVQRKIIIVHPSGDAESRIADDMEFTPWIFAPFGGLYVTWIPKYIKYFDSFSAPELVPGEFTMCEYPDDFEERFLKWKIQNYILTKWDDFLTWLTCKYMYIRMRYIPFKPQNGELPQNVLSISNNQDDVGSPDPEDKGKKSKTSYKLTYPSFLKKRIERSKDGEPMK